MRAAAIQAFGFTYELCWKMLKRYLEATLPNADEVDQMSFPTLIRTASEHGLLLSDWSVWKEYRQERGTTSHTYDEKKAIEVFAELPRFLKEAQYLLKQLKKRNKLI
jgi:nucleotidyltransferase substrate binding protein (TIGR01987 family)